jgi:hypothetical protein
LFFGFVNLLKGHHGGTDEAAKRYLVLNRVVAKGVQLRLLRQRRVVMTAQKAQADVLLHRLHYALPGWDAAAERRDAQDEFHSAAQARAWADGDFDANHGLAFDGVCGPPGSPEPGARPPPELRPQRFTLWRCILVFCSSAFL